MYGRKLLRFPCSCLPACIFFFLLALVQVFQSLHAQQFIRIDRLEFDGLKKTRPMVVLREITIREGTEISVADTADLFGRCRNNLLNTRLFHSCTYRLRALPQTDGSLAGFALCFAFQERWYTIPVPVLELADRNFNEWWYDRNRDLRRINAGLSILRKNVRGRNEDLLIGAQTGFTRRLDFSYFIPYLDRKQVFGLKVKAIFLGNKEVAVRSAGNRLQFVKDENSFGRERIQAGIQLTARRNIYRYHSVEFNYYYNRISPFIFQLNSSYFSGRSFQRYGEMRYTFTMDHRDYRYYATRGWLVVFRISRNGLLPGDNFSLWTAAATASRYQPLGKKWYWASRLDAEVAEDKKLPYLGSRTLGYENRYVRGYERNVLEGNASVYLRNSLRYRVFGKRWEWDGDPRFRQFPLTVYVSPFADAGYMHNSFVLPENRPLVNTLLLGYGAGIHVHTIYDLVLRMEYALNRQGRAGFYFSLLSDI